MITLSQPNGILQFADIALGKLDYLLLAMAILMLLVVSIVQEKVGSAREVIGRANIWIRWTIWIGLFYTTLIFGVYGPGTVSVFIYEVF